MNERKVIDVLMRHGASSRADLSRNTGISPPTISKAIETLVALGFVERHSVHENKMGRPGKLYSLANKSVQVLGVAIGDDGCWVASSGMDGVTRDESVSFFKAPDDYETLVDMIEERLNTLATQHPVRLLGVGVCVSGHINHMRQEVVRCHGLPYLGGRAISHELSQRMGCVSHLTSRAHAMCLAGYGRGENGEAHQILKLDAADGLTCGLSLGGKLVLGDHGLGGSLGYMPISTGGEDGQVRFLADLATDAALARLASERLGRKMRIEDVIEHVAGGGEELNDLIDETANYLAMGVATLVNIMDVGCLRIHAKMLDMERCSVELLNEKVEQFLAAPLEGRCVIERSKVSAVHGALAGIINKLTEQLGEMKTSKND